jgi:hypothetical protein
VFFFLFSIGAFFFGWLHRKSVAAGGVALRGGWRCTGNSVPDDLFEHVFRNTSMESQ